MADLELNSIGNGDGNNYLLRDNSKIPLSGTSALAGNIVPSTDNTYDLGSSSFNFNTIYCSYIKIRASENITCATDDSYFSLYGGTAYNKGSQIKLYGKDESSQSGCLELFANDGTNDKRLRLKPDGTLSWSGRRITSNGNSDELNIDGGSGYALGATLWLTGKNNAYNSGVFNLIAHNGTDSKILTGTPSGTLTWNGQSIQTTSDARLKQQITQIDDDLLTAWEDVEPVQFKYNDAVKEKSDNARLHTGYVVQQIDEACKSHNVDISKYGLYCHEEYPERTEEVTIENEDGTTSKETKVIEEASEHYSLRYTETLVVECAYLRRENTRLKTRLNSLESRLEQIEQSLK